MRVPRGQHHDIRFANREQNDASPMTEGDDQLLKLPVLLRSTTGVWRKREDAKRSLHRVAEPKEAQVVWRGACQLALNGVFFEAFDVLLQSSGRDKPKSFADPAPG